jgi:hypothetical protein
MGDILDGIGESMDDPEQTDKIYKDVLQEVGLEVDKLIPEANTKKIDVNSMKKEDDDLDKMLKEVNK